MPLSNGWVTYFDRSYEQIKAAVMTALGTAVPEITDHTDSDPITKEVSIWAGIAEQIGYYVDSMAREAFITACRLTSSAMAIANQLDYRVHAWVAASAEVTFTADAAADSDFVIPVNTIVSTNDGTPFVTTEEVTMLTGDTTVNATVVQHAAALSFVSFVSNGTPFQEYELPANIADGLVTVKVNGVTWTPQQTLAYSITTDKHYIQTVNGNALPVVRFGDGVMGVSPANGSGVVVYYYATLGVDGNAGQGTITNITSVIGIPDGATSLTVVNNVRASGGTANESLDSMRTRIPLSLRVMDRAVTRQDYIDNAKLVAGVFNAGVVYACGKWVDIYIVPDGGGIASDDLCEDVVDFLEPRRMITTLVRVFPAGEVRTKLNLKLKVLYGYDTAVVSAAVIDTLTTFISYVDQEIGGGLFLSDVYQQIEAVDGVDHSILISALFTPYAQKTPPTTLTLDWDVEALAPVTETAEWKLVAIDSTHFHLFRNEQFQGTVTVGVAFTSPEVTFTINTAAYTVDDTYTFWTYPSDLTIAGGVQLQEPSIFVSLPEDITITLI